MATLVARCILLQSAFMVDTKKKTFKRINSKNNSSLRHVLAINARCFEFTTRCKMGTLMLLYLCLFFTVSNSIKKLSFIGGFGAQYFWLNSKFCMVSAFSLRFVEFTQAMLVTRRGLMFLICLGRWGCGWIDSTPSPLPRLHLATHCWH